MSCNHIFGAVDEQLALNAARTSKIDVGKFAKDLKAARAAAVKAAKAASGTGKPSHDYVVLLVNVAKGSAEERKLDKAAKKVGVAAGIETPIEKVIADHGWYKYVEFVAPKSGNRRMYLRIIPWQGWSGNAHRAAVKAFAATLRAAGWRAGVQTLDLGLGTPHKPVTPKPVKSSKRAAAKKATPKRKPAKKTAPKRKATKKTAKRRSRKG